MTIQPVVSQHAVALAASIAEMIIDDATHVIQRVPYLERYPHHLWESGLVSELAEASDRLACVVAKLQEAQGADR